MYEHIVTNVAPSQVEFDAIIPTEWKHIVLDGTLDPNNGVDTDNDTVSDWKEVDTERIRWKTDGTAVYIGDKKIAPRDPEPLKMTGSEGIWLEHIEQEKNGIISTEYADEQPGLGVIVDKELADYVVKAALMLREPITYGGYIEEYVRPVILFVKKYCEGSTVIGAYLLNFIYDMDHVAYHSQIDTWQRNFGYNDFYDEIFRIGSYMDHGRLNAYLDDGTNYVLWMWKGDYWNMQSGAEIGLYVFQDDTNEIIDSETNHYDAVDFELPMTLSLYNYYGENSIDNLFNWEPTVEQWWITGFYPDFKEPRPSDMVVIGSVDFKEHVEIFEMLRFAEYSGNISKDNIIFGEDGHTLWVVWDTK